MKNPLQYPTAKIALFVMLLLLCSPAMHAQDTLSLDMFNVDRLKLNRGGMTVLGGWAVGNMAFSGVQYFRTEGSVKSFHQMNIIWNVVNLGLAAGGYFGGNPESGQGLGLKESIDEQYGLEKIFLVNAGLDVGYIMGGLFLREKSKTATKRNDLLKGYGNSVMLQGGFLLVFDAVMYGLHRSHAAQDLAPILEKISIGPGTVGMNFQF